MIKKINKEILLQQAQNKIAYYEEQKQIFSVIKEVFKTFEGKKITKRIESALQNELLKIDSNLYCSYQKDTYDYTFYIWNRNDQKQITYKNRIMLMIHKWDLIDDAIFNYDRFINHFTWLNNTDKNIEEIQKEIKILNDSNIIEEYNRAIETIESTKNLLGQLKYNI